MDGDDAAAELRIAGTGKASLLDHRAKIFSGRKLADRFDKVAIGFGIARDELADRRNGPERISLINAVERCDIDLRKFETEKMAAPAQHAISLFERDVDARHVADAESDRIGVEIVVWKRQRFRIGFDEGEFAIKTFLLGTRATDGEHLGIDV